MNIQTRTMVKINELRLGSMIAYGAHGLVIVNEIKASGKIRVTHTEQSSINLGYINSLLREVNLDPLPITAAWLERMGFIKDRSGWHMPETKFSLTEQFYPCWLDRMLWPQDIQDFRETSLAYAHRLQNLYFTLTGDELNVRL